MKKEYKKCLISIMQSPTIEMLYSSGDFVNDNWVDEDDLPWGNN